MEIRGLVISGVVYVNTKPARTFVEGEVNAVLFVAVDLLATEAQGLAPEPAVLVLPPDLYLYLVCSPALLKEPR